VTEIGLVEVPADAGELPPAGIPFSGDDPTVTLRFLVSANGLHSLEALRNARRALLREEWTRGRGPDEPSLEDAVFSSREIHWDVRPDQRAWCLEKLEELRRRANLLLTEVEPA
jgi:hypothetical protein